MEAKGREEKKEWQNSPERAMRIRESERERGREGGEKRDPQAARGKGS